MLCILVEVLSRAHVKRGKSLNDFKFGTSTGRFSSAGAASTAVKGLINFLPAGWCCTGALGLVLFQSAVISDRS